MRLLSREEDGNFSLVEYVGKDIPPYAILSHTWGADNEELTYKDILEGVGQKKAGYRKLTFCGKQAAKDNLQFFWVDTCCIDKSSSAELSEAINSMFRWYQGAARCYVYLADVSVDVPVGGSSTIRQWEQAFTESRWFTRGWTLQEFIAPKTVEFFSKEGHRLGTKQSLEQALSEITRIPVAALRGRPLSHFPPKQRILWAEGRHTKREEDAAYSLLGIFDIQMPLLYGEGRQKALDRLRKRIDKPLNVLRRHVYQQTQRLDNVDTIVQKVLRQMRNRPKELGFPWETGTPEDHVKIDDGLGPEYFLPVELCETPKAFYDTLLFKYKSKNLPGLAQIERGHILLWEWNERHLVSRENWMNVIKGDRAVKVSFVMRSWHGPPRNRCMRCYKPRTNHNLKSSFQYCNSCKLAVLWVEPDYLPFEPIDTLIDRDIYRDFKIASRTPNIQEKRRSADAYPAPFFETRGNDVLPTIDFVCHRLTMKWEPIFNIVYRYVLCRCVLRLNTPSRLEEEMAFFVNACCPRHNTRGIRFRDYNEFAIPCLEDPYFDRFGGYNAFWAMLHNVYPAIYQALGGSKSITEAQLEYGDIDLRRMEKNDSNAVWEIASDYWVETAEVVLKQRRSEAEKGQEKGNMNRDALTILDMLPNGPPEIRKLITRKLQETGKTTFNGEVFPAARNKFRESSLGKELEILIRGDWDGVPHWSVDWMNGENSSPIWD